MIEMKDLIISSPSFSDGGEIPKKHTGFGEDISPAFIIEGLIDEAVSITIIMDDLDVPMRSEYNHWLFWNIPAINKIPESIPCGEVIESLQGARQGVGYGKNRYRGPKQPPFIKKAHRYRFVFYSLDCVMNIAATSKKSDVVKAMSGHILQSGQITGWYKPDRYCAGTSGSGG